MNDRTVNITFERHQVAVISRDSEILRRVRIVFQEMISSSPDPTADQLEIQNRNDRYWLLENGCPVIEDESLSEITDQIKYHTAMLFMRARPDLLWVHAGAAMKNGSAVVILGSFGMGKSTIVTELVATGWQYLSDDIVPLNPVNGDVSPFPQKPRIREFINREIPRGKICELRKLDVELGSDRICRDRTPVSMFIFPRFEIGISPGIQSASKSFSVLEVLRSGLNTSDHSGETIRKLCGLLEGLPTCHLPFTDGREAAALVDSTMEKLSGE